MVMRLPEPIREPLLRHRESSKFMIVGGTCFLITLFVNYLLKFTVLGNKVVTAQIIAMFVATVASYALNREWSFRTRGGRHRRAEITLFFVISGVGMAINAAPLWVARYLLDFQEPHVGRMAQEISDFASGIVIGTALAMVFRLWAFRRWVFPVADARPNNGAFARAEAAEAAAALEAAEVDDEASYGADRVVSGGTDPVFGQRGERSAQKVG